MEEVSEIIDRSMSGNGNLFYFTGINNSADNYWPETEPYFVDIAGEQATEDIQTVEKVKNRAEIGYRLAKIIQGQITPCNNPDGCPPPELGVIPPYVEKLVLDFYKPNTDDLLELRDSQGELLDENYSKATVIQTGTGDAIQTLEVIRPLPGIYELTTTATTDEFLIDQQLIFIQSKLIQPAESMQQFKTGEIQVQLVDSNDKPIPDYDDPRYRLQVTADISSDSNTYSVFLSHVDQGILHGNFIPLDSGEHQISITATAVDDNNKSHKILYPPRADFDFLVDGVEVIIGDAQSDRSDCALTQYLPFSMPISFINVSNNKNATISLPMQWNASSNPPADITIEGPDTNGEYLMRVLPGASGEHTFSISSSVMDPVDGQPLPPFLNKDIYLSAVPGLRLKFSISELLSQPDKLTRAVESMIGQLYSAVDPEFMVIGRRFLFWPQDVVIRAELIDLDTGQIANQSDLLPTLTLESLTGKDKISGSGWQSISGNLLENTIKTPPLGIYQIVLDSQNMPCGADLTIADGMEQRVLIVPNFGDRLMLLLIVLIGLSFLFLIIRFFVCRYKNPLDGFMALVNSQGRKVWFQSLAGRSCWKFPMGRVIVGTCQVYMIKISGWRFTDGIFIIRVTEIVYDEGGKPIRRKVTRKTGTGSHWQDIPLMSGCRIIWRKTQGELPR